MNQPEERELEQVEGERIVLRELVRDDVDGMALWPRFIEPDLLWANLELTSSRERDAWYERSRGNSTRRRFTMLDRTGRVIGTIGLRNIDFRFGEGTLGIIINAADVSKGYGADAIICLVHYAFQRLGLRKVFLDVANGNERAFRCYCRVGFVETGQHRGTDGLQYIDMVITRERFRSVHGPRPHV